MAEADNFSIKFYTQTLTRLLSEPRSFFKELADGEISFRQSLGFLTASGLFFSVASVVTSMYPSPLLMGGIFLINTIGMTFMASGLGYVVMTMAFGKKATFRRLFSLYALATGGTLLAAWVPFLALVTEPWKWWMIATGMINALGLNWKQAALVIVASIGVLILTFWSLIPLVNQLN